jgi:hypothetical protein
MTVEQRHKSIPNHLIWNMNDDNQLRGRDPVL